MELNHFMELNLFPVLFWETESPSKTVSYLSLDPQYLLGTEQALCGSLMKNKFVAKSIFSYIFRTEYYQIKSGQSSQQSE